MSCKLRRPKFLVATIAGTVLSALFTIGLCQAAFAGPEDEVHARFGQWIATFTADSGQIDT